MSADNNWHRCPGCDEMVHAFGVGDNTLTLGKETYHADCVELDDLTSEELLEIADRLIERMSTAADDILQNRAESNYEAWLSDYYGGTTPTFAERYQQNRIASQEGSQQ